MIIDPQSPPIVPQNANVEPFPPPTMSIPASVAEAPEAQAPGMLQRAAQQSPMGWGQRQSLPQPQAPQYRPQMPQQGYGGGFGGGQQGFGGFGNSLPPWMQSQGGGWGGPPQQQWGGAPQQWGGPPQMPQWAPPWMQQGGQGYGGPPPWMQQRRQYQPQQQTPPYMPPQASPSSAPQYRAPNGNAGIGGGLPQYNSQAYRPQPAGQVNTQAPPAAPPALPNRQAAITPTPIYDRSNELA